MYNYEFNKEKCWYKESCSKYKTSECYKGCIRYMEMHYLMNSAGIPESRQYPTILTPDKRDLIPFNELQLIKNDIVDFVKNGASLYIWSENTGNGKTTWGLKLIQKYFDEIWLGNGFKPRALLVNVPTFLNKCKENISFKDESFEEFKRLIPVVDVVLWDDIAAINMKDFDYSNLFTYVEQRIMSQKSNIYTSNHNFESLVNVAGERLASRIWNGSFRHEFQGRDRRAEQ